MTDCSLRSSWGRREGALRRHHWPICFPCLRGPISSGFTPSYEDSSEAWLSLVLLFTGGGVKSRRKEKEERWTEKEISTESTRPEKEITDHRIRVQEGRTTKGQLREPESHCEQGTTKAAHKFILSCPRGQLSSQTDRYIFWVPWHKWLDWVLQRDGWRGWVGL